jgi:hypothetical protein
MASIACLMKHPLSHVYPRRFRALNRHETHPLRAVRARRRRRKGPGGILPTDYGPESSQKRLGLPTKESEKTMTTKLTSAFKRELDLNGEKYTVTLSPEGFKLVQKGKRKGIELAWQSIIGGDAALATALNASVAESSGHRSSLGIPTKH